MRKIIAVVGPTAVGKTALGVGIAKAINGEVVSADSRQVYRGLDLGAGKVTVTEMEGVPHHLLDIADPAETFTAADFVRRARAAIEDIAEREKVPIVVGGTGFYIDALLGRMTLADVPPNEELREDLRALSLEELQEKLQSLDPERYATVDLKNRRRVERAIEIARSETPPSSLIHLPSYDVLWLGLTLPLPELKERIHMRLFSRMVQGMLDEAKRLHENGLSWERMEDLGLEYRYMARHLAGQISYDEMIANLEKEIAHYAKRQMTWFKKNKEIEWFSPEEAGKMIELVTTFL